jgi:sterol desaturase/sphingolipid hydroxylase (fatty acid hydroxylase superfamily)
LLQSLTGLAQFFLHRAQELLLSWGSVFSLASLASALVIAVASLVWARASRRRAVRVRVLLRALFPARLVKAPSSRADLGMFLFNTFPAAVLFGWMIASASQVSGPVADALTAIFGPRPHAAPEGWPARAIITVALFAAYEFAYWLDHYLSHRVPFLWEFHKVHHTAEVLTPLTVFRVHPVDSLVFANIAAVVMGVTGGLLRYAFGAAAHPFAVSGENLILVAFVFATIHLQHSHIWISFTGLAGRILLSPAHHQIHHSADPIHFNRNFGSCLSVWDWMFGTLQVPAGRREPLKFGAEVSAGAPSPHSVSGVLLAPFAEAFGRAAAALRPAALARLPDSQA